MGIPPSHLILRRLHGSHASTTLRRGQGRRVRFRFRCGWFGIEPGCISVLALLMLDGSLAGQSAAIGDAIASQV
jgi:hypothetical protein